MSFTPLRWDGRVDFERKLKKLIEHFIPPYILWKKRALRHWYILLYYHIIVIAHYKKFKHNKAASVRWLEWKRAMMMMPIGTIVESQVSTRFISVILTNKISLGPICKHFLFLKSGKWRKSDANIKKILLIRI